MESSKSNTYSVKDLTSLPERSIVKPNLSGVKTPGCEFPVNKSNIVSGRFSSGPPAADSLRHTGGGNAGAANTVTSTGTAEQNRHPIVDFTDVPNLQALNDEDRQDLESKAALFSGFSSEFAKFLKNTNSSDPLTKKCSVKLINIDANKSSEKISMETKISSGDVTASAAVTTPRKHPPMDDTMSRHSSSDTPVKRDNDPLSTDGPAVKKPKSEDIIVLDGSSSNSTSPEISLVKITKPSSSPKDNFKSDSGRSSDIKSKMEKHIASSYSKPFNSDSGSRKTSDGSSSNNSSSSNSNNSSSNSQAAKSNSSKPADNSDRTSLRDLEARLMHLQQKAAQEHKAKNMSPSVVKTGNKDNHHRRPDHTTSSFSLERKKSVSSGMSPVKPSIKHKKHLSSPSSGSGSVSSRDGNKMGSLFSPSNDSKVTILPCKTVPKDGDHKLPSVGSNSVTITKVSSGDSLNVSSKDIKKVFSPKSSESRSKHSDLDPNSLFKPDKVKVKSSDRPEKSQKDIIKVKDKDHRPKDKDRERSGRVGSLKIIRCSKCREVFSTKEAKKLHTCNSILDAHFLIDGGDRQKTSPVSNSSTSDRSESTSASLSRSSSRSSSPGLSFPSSNKKSESPRSSSITSNSSKIVKKLDEERFSKVKISINKLKTDINDDDDKNKERKFSDKPVVKKDPMREKWIESKRTENSQLHGGGGNNANDSSSKRSDGIIIEHVVSGGQSLDMDKERKIREDVYPPDPAMFAFSGKRTYSPSMTESQHLDGKVSPRETNNKDSPASQADSGIFSIASSASPSKVDGGTDIRSPDSPRINDTQKHEQWKPGSTVLSTSTADSKAAMNYGPNPTSASKPGMSGNNGFPTGISLPINTSITRVASSTNYSINTSSMQHKSNVTTTGQSWTASQVISQSYYYDEKDRKQKNHRGRPKKNGDPVIGGKGKILKSKGSSDEDKDMYAFDMEEDEDKPVQPLRPRRQNAQPVTYKDPDSDEDAKLRKPMIPLIQATQGYKDIHEKSQSFPSQHFTNMSLSSTDDDHERHGDELDGDEKDKNVLYKCSTIEETPTGGIKLKIKIKKSASPVSTDLEPPLKKAKVEEPEVVKTEPSILHKPPTSMSHPHLQHVKTEMKVEPNISQAVSPVVVTTSSNASSTSPAVRTMTPSMTTSHGLSSVAGGVIKPKITAPPPNNKPITSTSMVNSVVKKTPPVTSTVTPTVNNVSSMNSINPRITASTASTTMLSTPKQTSMTTATSMLGTQTTTSFSKMHNNPPVSNTMSNNAIGSNNNPTVSESPSFNSSMDDPRKMGHNPNQYPLPTSQVPPVSTSAHSPAGIQGMPSQGNLGHPGSGGPMGPHPPISGNSNLPNQNNFEMQRSFTGNNYMDMTSYSSSYMNYSQQQQQHSMYSSNQYQQHMSAFRPGIRPGNIMASRPQQPPGGYMPNRMMDPRFVASMGDSDPMHHGGGMNPHQNPMGMQGMMPSHMAMSMRHPSMMGGMHQGMGNPNMPMNPFPGSPVHAGMNQKGMGMGMGMPNGGPMMNSSSVMNPLSSGGNLNPRAMSPHTERPLIGPPAMSPSSGGGNERGGMFPSGQFRLNSPQYSPHHQSQTNFGQSPNYSGPQGYPGPSMYKPPTPQTHSRPPTPQQQQQSYKPPTPQQQPNNYPQPLTPQQQNYPQSTTPQHSSCPKPPTPQNNYPKPPTPQGGYPQPLTPQNPTTPGGSYQNPSTPGTYHNPSTPVSQQNPLTPQSFDPHTPGGSQHNSSFDSPTNQPVMQNNLMTGASSFVVPKTENSMPPLSTSVKVTTPPMLSPPSTTSSLRNIRIPPKKSVTPGTTSPGPKNHLSPHNSDPQVPIKSEPSDIIVPKSEPVPSSPLPSPKSEPPRMPTPNIKQEATPTPTPTPSPLPIKEEVKEEVKEEKPPTPPPKPPTPVPVKTPEPPKEPRWGEDGPEGMPERALEIIFSYISHTEGCLPFLPNMMRVCKLWHKVASKPELWTHANLGSAVKEKMRTEKKLEWILKNKFPHAVQVDVTSWKAVMSSPALRIIASTCPKLSGLGLSNCVKLNYEDIRIIPSLFPNLRRVDLSLVSPSTASSRSAVSSTALSDLITTMGENLTHFNMSSNKMAGLPFVFKALSQHSKNLRFLDVSNISTTSRDTILINIEKLQKGCPLLTTFRTTNTMLGLNDVPVREQVMSPGFPMLEELTIGVDQRGYFDGMDDQQIERILKKSSKLRLLDIRGCKGISDSTLVRLPCWDIEYLYVAGCSVTSSSRDGLELLVKKWCRTLIELDIGLTSDQKTVDWAVMALVENEEDLKLRKLNLTGTAVSLKPLTKLLNCCSTLASLNLTSCRALPRGMKRMYHSRDDVEGLAKDIADGKFDARDAGSDDDD